MSTTCEAQDTVATGELKRTFPQPGRAGTTTTEKELAARLAEVLEARTLEDAKRAAEKAEIERVGEGRYEFTCRGVRQVPVRFGGEQCFVFTRDVTMEINFKDGD